MTSRLIARHQECEELQRCLDSNESEFAIVCGRRRIGKTFLVEQFFEGKYDFKFVGGHNLRTREQLSNFSKALKAYSGKQPEPFKDWSGAFDALADYLSSLPKDRRKVIFIDEMPWADTKRSDFVRALEYFWNGWASGQYNIVLIATGSATSWMTEKLLMNRGGLYNRVRHRIYLKPFTLKETEEYLLSRSIDWDRYQILQSYMLTGGVPFYLNMLDGRLSLAQNIDRLCFDDTGALKMEFDELYSAVFPGAESYVEVVRSLADNRTGLTRSDISSATKISGAFLSRLLANLERCGFIDRTSLFGRRKTEEVYRLTDFYTLFYFKFIENNLSKDSEWWTHHLESSAIRAWMGFSFELVCMQHHNQIKKALGISGMATSISTWRSKPDKEKGIPGAQIDMIIERADRIIHLCEMKFSESSYSITKEYEKKLRERMGVFKEQTKTKKSVVHTFVTTYGVTNGVCHSIVHSEVTMDDLFNA